MAVFLTSVVRFLPNPITGEFVNIGVIGGNPVNGEWDVRWIDENSKIANFIGSEHNTALSEFKKTVSESIALEKEKVVENLDFPFVNNWLFRTHERYMNLIQLADPRLINDSDLNSSLNSLYEKMIVHSIRNQKSRTPSVSNMLKDNYLKTLYNFYQSVEISNELISQNSKLVVGSRIKSPIDYAIGNGQVVQVCQIFNVQQENTGRVAASIKDWTLAVERIQDQSGAKFTHKGRTDSRAARDVSFEVVFTPPLTADQVELREYGEEIFAPMENVTVNTGDQLNEIAHRAFELISPQ